jgi:hypothetical protein
LLAYLVPLDVDVTGNTTAKFCEVWSEFKIFCTLVTMATAAILNCFNVRYCFAMAIPVFIPFILVSLFIAALINYNAKIKSLNTTRQ